MGKKIRVTQELIDRAEASFSMNSTQATNEEFTRAELRALERKGIIRSAIGRADPGRKEEKGRKAKGGMIRKFWAISSYNLTLGMKVKFK